jgi:hypothetical protein
MQRSVLLQPRRRFALIGPLVLVGMLLLASAGEYKEFRRAENRGVVAAPGYEISFIILITLSIVAPILAFIAIRRTNRVSLSPADVEIGQRRAAWSDIHEVTWEGGRGGNVLVLHPIKGQPLKVPASMYEGGEEGVLMLLKNYLPAQVLAAAEAELRASD